MFEQIKILIASYRDPQKTSLTTIKGQIIALLKSLHFFKVQMNQYGAEILEYYIPLLEPYFIRQGADFLDDSESFVVVEGLIRSRKPNGQLGSVFCEGMIIQPSDNKQGTLFSQANSNLLKICKGFPKTKKEGLILSAAQKQRTILSREMAKKINLDPNMTNCRQILEKHQFFSSLGVYDMNYLVTQSKIVVMPKNSVTNSYGAEVGKLGFILNGKIKITHPLSSHQPIQPGKQILEKYMIHKKNISRQSIVTYMGNGEWLGLQEYFWEQNFCSKGEVVSHEAELLIVPVPIFARLFNETTQYNLCTKMRGLIDTKKALMSKNMKNKKNRQDSMKEQLGRQKLLEKLSKKMNSLQVSPTKNETQQRIQKRNKSVQRVKSNFPSQNLDAKPWHNHPNQQFSHPTGIKTSRMARVGTSITHKDIRQECYMPERLIHKLKVFEQKYHMELPQITERVSLFPEEYKKASIPLDLKHKIIEMENARNKKKGLVVKKSNRSFNLMNPERIYERVIFDCLSPRETYNTLEDSRSTKHRLTSNKSIETLRRMNSRDLGEQSKQLKEFNMSICNNFRAPKNRGQKLLENMYKTLQIN